MSNRITVPIDMGKDLKPLRLRDCKHEEFVSFVKVTGVAHEEGQAPHTFDVELRVLCADCGELLCFRGAPHEIGFRRPNVNIDGTTLSAPAEPSGDYDLTLLDEWRAKSEKR